MSGIRRQFSLKEDRYHGARVIGPRGAVASPTATGVAAGEASVKINGLAACAQAFWEVMGGAEGGRTPRYF